jgi:hypothetical protein
MGSNAEAFCEGAAVGPSAVLTAAHCVDRHDPRDVIVKVNGEVYGIAEVKIHPDYQPQAASHQFPNSDLAIVVTDRTLPGAILPILTSETIEPGSGFRVITGSPRDRVTALDTETRFAVTPYESVLRVVLASTPEGPRNPRTVEELERRLDSGDPWLKEKMQNELGGLLFSLADEQSGAICLGDSGAPALATLGGVPAIIGVVTAIALKREDSVDGCVSGGLSIFTRVSDAATIQFLDEAGVGLQQF